MTASQTNRHQPIAVGGSSRQLMAAVIVSLLVHAALVLLLQGRPLGWIDPELLAEQRHVFRVYRSEHDLIIDDPAGDFPGQESTSRSLTDLSKALLETEPAAGRSQDAPPDVALREFQEYRPDWSAGAPKVQLPESVTRQNLGQQVSLPFVAGPDGDGQGEGDGVGEGGVGQGSGSAEARLALRDAGLTPRGASTGPVRPELNDTMTPQDQWDAPISTAAPIDFMGMALAGTRQLNIPEHLDDDFDYTLYTYMPQPERGLFGPKELSDKRGFFRVDVRAKRTLRKLPTMPKDVIFLIDTSGSVSQEWVAQVQAGVQDGLATLNENDRFNIVMFKEAPSFLSADSILAATQANIERAVAFLEDAASGGYTDVNAALSRLLVRDVSTERVYNLVLISDGIPTRGVMDTRELINLITRDNDLAAGIYCVGVGSRQNRELLDFLAYRNRGFRVFVERPEQTRTVLRNLFSTLRYPIMKNVQLETAGLNGDVYPTIVPDIHQGQTFSIFGRFSEARPFTMRLHGRNGKRLLDFTFTRDLADGSEGDKQMVDDWAFWKLHHLYSLMLQEGQTQTIRQEIDKLRKDYGVKTIY